MRWLFWLTIALFSCDSWSAASKQGVGFLTINTEWLWTPFDNKVDGEVVNQGDMKVNAYRQEIRYYANLAHQLQARVVALQEIENKQVAQELATELGGTWKAYFKQGRDTATGQDVALLSDLSYVNGSLTDFGFPKGFIKGVKKGKRLSKLVGASFYHPASHQPFWAITTHFLSRKNESKARQKKRLMQVDSLIRAAQKVPDEVPLVILGDFNSAIETIELRQLQQALHLNRASQQCAEQHTTQAENSSKQIKPSSLIDHIFYRKALCQDYRVLNLKRFSDHPGIFARLF